MIFLLAISAHILKCLVADGKLGTTGCFINTATLVNTWRPHYSAIFSQWLEMFGWDGGNTDAGDISASSGIGELISSSAVLALVLVLA